MSAEDSIDRAVDEAIIAGMSPRKFVEIARECWAARLHDKAKYDAELFRIMLTTRVIG